MARFERAEAILDAAKLWREKCLVKDGSLFTRGSLWTLEHLEELDQRFIQHPDERKVDFLTKLEGQLAPASPDEKKLAAEMLWVMYLMVSSDAMGAETKRYQVRTVWGWSGDELPEDHDLLGDVLGKGVANTGPGYNTHRPLELEFFITMMEDWKRLERDRRVELLGDPWTFAEWIEGRERAPGRQLRHILLFLLFPDDFEHIATASHKQKIVRVFRTKWGEDPFDQEDRIALDREVLRIRQRLAEKHPDAEELDFYRPPLVGLWRSTDPEPSETGLPDSDESEAWLAERFGNHSVWCISAGGGGRLWDDFVDQEIIAIPWDHLGDLTESGSRDEIQEKIAEEEGRENPTTDSLAVWQFAREMKPGDVVIAKQGNSRLLGWGRVTGEYTYEPSRAEYRHVRPVEWKKKGSWEIPRERNITPKTLTRFNPYPSWLRWAFRYMEDEGGQETKAREGPEYPVAEALKDLFLDPGEFSAILDNLARRRNVILQGPPGVGKTFVARRLAYALIGRKAPAQVQLVQFHQSYAYEDFVQGWRPNEQGGFVLRNGVFHDFCRRAAADGDGRYVFVIDEINRGNLSRIFGELMMLIESDKRGPEHAIPLTYSGGETFYVPANVHLVGLMNTADRSLAMVDYALRRRFGFIDLKPAFGTERFTGYLLRSAVPEEIVARINGRMGALNAAIREDRRNLGPGFEIGHSFFVPTGEEAALDEGWYRAVIETEIGPLLREYWFDQPERVDEHLARLRT